MEKETAVDSAPHTTTEVPAAEHPTTVAHANDPVPRPAGWMYRSFRLGSWDLWYASPKVQLFMVAMVCFLCPGMFNALSGLGAGGQVDATAQDNSGAALYSTFAVVGFFAGTFANRLGLRLTLAFGGLGYCIYSASFLCYNHTSNDGFVVFAGAFLGVCAGLLWTGQGAIMMSYPNEASKGRYISAFWMIFNLGAVIGALIPLGQNINKVAGPVTDGTYAGFIVLMFLGAVIALFLCDADRVVREDGSRVIVMKNPTWRSELVGLWETLLADPWIVLLFPMFFFSNVFYTYQFNDFNGASFNTRTRSLNNLLYWLSQIFGACAFGFGLDSTHFSRTMRAKIAYVILFVLTMVIWGGAYAWEQKQPLREVKESTDGSYTPADWTDGGDLYIGPMFLYMFFGFYDACWQVTVYWYMGALSNSGRKTANYAGFYKGVQSAGNAIFWRIDGLKKPYSQVFGATWGGLVGALVFAAPVIWMKIKDTVPIEEDLKLSDETVEDVVPTAIHEKTAEV